MKRVYLSVFIVFLLCVNVLTPVLADAIDKNTAEKSYIGSDQNKSISGSSQDEILILDNGKCGENLFWELNSDGLLRIFGEGPMYDYNKYYEPAPWYKYRDEPYISGDGKNILDKNGSVYLSTEGYYALNPDGYKVKSIEIESGVTYIGDWAFYRVCVEEITVPETVTETGIFCFRYSPVLKVLNLPDSLKVLDDFAVSKNYSLETINIGNSLEKVGVACFINNTSLKELVLPDTCTTINKQLSPAYAQIDYSRVGLLENCFSLTYVDFGRVTEIPQRTCQETSLETVVIPNTVESIGAYAFYGCASLKNIVFEEDSVCHTINNTAFTLCISLESVEGGVSLENLGLYTSLSTLKEFDFSVTNKLLENKQFLGTSLEEVRISDNITVIPVSCFNGMTSLERIYLPATLTEIKASSFNYCTSLEDVFFDGTLAQWLSVQKASGWNYRVNSECMLHLKDGTSVSFWNIPATDVLATQETEPTEPSEPETEPTEKPTQATDPTEVPTIALTEPSVAETETTEPSETEPIPDEITYLIGDANGDAKVNIKDVTQVQKALAGLLVLDELCNLAADVDLNGKLNIKDATAIQKFVAGIPVDAPIGEERTK